MNEIERLNLASRLDAAMRKAGVNVEVKLSPASVTQDFYDVGGIGIECDDAEVRQRAAVWVKAALVKAGVKEWHRGAWHGDCVMGNPEVLHETVYGKPVTLVRLVTYSIGD